MATTSNSAAGESGAIACQSMMIPILGAANAAAGRRVGGAVGGSVPAIERDGGGFFEQDRGFGRERGGAAA